MDLRSTVGIHSCYEGHCSPVDGRVVSADPEAWIGQHLAAPLPDTCDPCLPDCHESGCHDTGGEG